VGSQYKEDSDNTLNKAHRRSQGILAVDNTDTVNIRVQNIDSTRNRGVGKIQHLIKTGVEKKAEVQNKHGNHGGNQGGNDYVTDYTKTSNTVNFSGFKKGRIDGDNCRKEDD